MTETKLIFMPLSLCLLFVVMLLITNVRVNSSYLDQKSRSAASDLQVCTVHSSFGGHCKENGG